MNHRDRHHKHTALMLLACAFAFVYLLARQFQGQEIVHKWEKKAGSHSITNSELPSKLEPIKTNSTFTGEAVQANSGDSISSNENHPAVATGLISFTSLNAVPQSFMRVGIKNTAGIMMDKQRIIVTTNTNTIAWVGDSKTFIGPQARDMGLMVDSVTFYNDSSWAGVLVIMEVVHNQQSLLIQAPYNVWRDDKPHLNNLIAQLTQK